MLVTLIAHTNDPEKTIAAAAKLPILQVNCFPANLPMTPVSIPARFAPYKVPSVTVFPEKALD